MLLKIGIIITFVLSVAQAQTLTLCEALQRLSELNGKEVKIRGVWAVGDTGQDFIAIPQCPQHTIRDGWIWRDIIDVYPADGRASVGGFIAKYSELAKTNHEGKVLATLTGRLETRDHFEVRTLPDGTQQPRAYRYYVALLRYRSVEDLEVVPFGPGERGPVIEALRKPEATRLK